MQKEREGAGAGVAPGVRTDCAPVRVCVDRGMYRR